MIFKPLPIRGAFLIELELLVDERGHFARTFSVDEFAARGLDPTVAQCNISFNARRGTLRGLHLQAEPHAEAKLIRCTRGRLHDKGVDVRRESETFGMVASIDLEAGDGLMVYLPAGVAHGFITLVDDTEVSYQMSQPYVSGSARGIRWDDPSFTLEWPEDIAVISERDRSFPDFLG